MSESSVLLLALVFLCLGAVVYVQRLRLREAASFRSRIQALVVELRLGQEQCTEHLHSIRALAEAMPQSVIFLNERQEILRVNESALGLFSEHSTRESVLHKNVLEVLRSAELCDILDARHETRVLDYTGTTRIHQQKEEENVLGTERQPQGQISLWQSGEQRSYRVYVRNITSDPASPVVCVLEDVSEFLYLEQVRLDFVSNVSHELKTPLTVIQGFAETLLDGALKDEAASQNFVDIILQQSLKLKDIVSNLLTLSELEQNLEKTGLPLEEVDLCKLVHKCKSLSMSRYKNDVLDITIRCDASTEKDARTEQGAVCMLNAGLLEQVFINLFDNAVHHGGEGVQVFVELRRTEAALIIEVRDTGRGIPLRFIPHVFERFFRVEHGGNAAGSGIGLAIVKHIVQAHKGRIDVHSVVGEGTTFTIRIPQ